MEVEASGLRYFIGKRNGTDKIQHLKVPGQASYFSTSEERLAEIALDVYNRLNDEKAEIFEIEDIHAKPRYVPSIRDTGMLEPLPAKK